MIDLNVGLIPKSMLWLHHLPAARINRFEKLGVKRHIQSRSLGNLEMDMTQYFRILSLEIAKCYIKVVS